MQRVDVLSLCDLSQNVLRPWVEAGFCCVSVDVQSYSRLPQVAERIIGDVRDLVGKIEASIVVAFPPCTHLASSGARHWKAKGDAAFQDAKSIVDACRQIIGDSHGFIENPRGRITSILGMSDAVFHPWHYTEYELGDAYTKETRLWLYGRAVCPRASVANNTVVRENVIDGLRRNDPFMRSITPMGFSRAFYEANRRLLGV